MELLDPGLPVDWLPGETLYSLLSRLHVVAGHRRSSDISKALFGDARRGGSATLVTHLGALDEAVKGQLGSVRSLFFERQIAGYYRAFLDPDDQETVVGAAQRGVAAKRLRSMLRCAIPASELRYCPDCVTHDRNRYGAPFWHVEHQLPCAYACTTHGNLLIVTQSAGASSWLNRWSIPPTHQTAPGQIASSLVRELSKAAKEIHSLAPSLRIDLARSRSMAIGKSEARITELILLVETELQIRLPRERDGTARQAKSDPNIWPLLFYGLAGPEADIATWLKSLESVAPSHEGNAAERKPQDLRERLVGLVRSGTAVSTAARQLGIDVKTGQTWAARELGHVPRRPSRIQGLTELMLFELARRGADKQLIARETGLSMASITAFILTRPELDRERRVAQGNLQVAAAKERLLQLTAALDRVTLKVCRALEPAAYALLLRRDRVWLQEFAEGLGAASDRSNDAGASESLIAAIESVASTSQHPSAKVSAADLLQRSSTLLRMVEHLVRQPAALKRLQALHAEIESRQRILF